MTSDWAPDCDVATARRRADVLAQIRRYFNQHDVLEVQTPLLSAAAVSDVHIESIRADVTVLGRPMYLHTSPEYAMKRLLAAGFPDCYQLCTVFRDGECGARHQPEFTMLEWYRHGFDLQSIIDDTTALIRNALAHTSAHDAADNAPCQWRYDAALANACGLDSDSAIDALRGAAGAGFPAALRDDRDALLDFLFDDRVARNLRGDALTVVTHYPASQAALAKIDPACHRALRFEVYLGGLELANGFVELQDAAEQRRRFDNDQRRRSDAGLPQRPIDAQFLAALAAGLPDCAGVALGVDRLVMLAAGKKTIGEVLSFAHRTGN